MDSNEQYYNCNRLGYNRKDCNQPNQRKTRESRDSCISNRLFSRISQNNNNVPPASHQKRAYQVIVDDNSDSSESFIPGPVAKAMIVAESSLPEMKNMCKMWYLDRYAFQHLCNNKSLFKDL